MAPRDTVLSHSPSNLPFISLEDLRTHAGNVVADRVRRAIDENSIDYYHVLHDGLNGESVLFLRPVDVVSLFSSDLGISPSSFKEGIVPFSETAVDHWRYVPKTKQRREAPSSSTSSQPSDREVRGVQALEQIAGHLGALVTLLSRTYTPTALLEPLIHAVRRYWKQEGLVNENKVCVRGDGESTLADFLEPVSIKDTANTISKPYRWVVARLTESRPYEQEFLHWQRRAHKGCSSVAAQAILYFALIRSLASSRLEVERVARTICHAAVDDVRTAAASVGLTVIGKGDSYNSAQLKERLVLPVVLYALKQYTGQ